MAAAAEITFVPSRKRTSPADATDDASKTKKRRAPRYDGYDFDDINEYEMVSEIGEGSFSVVAKARHRRTGETVAVKWVQQYLDDGRGLLGAVVREAGCLAACRGDPGIVQIKTVATDEDTGDLYIVMELIAGGATLRSHLAARGRSAFTEDEARDAMRQLLMAAEKLRATGTIHRDINPDNILVTEAAAGGERVVKLCGFGCATPESRMRRMGVGERVGSLLQYCAPEQLWGISKYGTEADVWALGCVMAEMLAGEPLFTAATEDGMIEEVVRLRDEFVTMEVEAFDGTALDHLSVAGREVLAGLLAFHSDERLTAAEALQHRWFTGEEEEEEVQEDDQVEDDEEEEDPVQMTLPGFESSIAAPAA